MIIGDSVMVAIDWYGSFVKPMQGSLHPKQQGMNLFSIAFINSQFLFVVHCDSRIVIQLRKCNYPMMP